MEAGLGDDGINEGQGDRVMGNDVTKEKLQAKNDQ